MTSLKSLKEQTKKLDKKLDKKNPYPPIKYFKACQYEEMLAYRSKHPDALCYYNVDNLMD